MRGRLGRIGLVVAVAAMVAACAPQAAADRTVRVDVADFSITLDPASGPQGRIEFEVSNAGPSVHEFEVFAGATAGQVLTVENSVADTTGLDLVDEIEDLLPGSVQRLTVDLGPGTYLVMCNLPGHYAQGMWAFLTITE